MRFAFISDIHANLPALNAVLAEIDYRDDKELTGFDAFSEEEFDDDDSGSA